MAVFLLTMTAAAFFLLKPRSLELPATVSGSRISPVGSEIPDKENIPDQQVPLQELEIDIINRRVLIPETGWMDAREFWEIYFNQPEKLPAEIDFERLRQFEQVTETQRKQALKLLPDVSTYELDKSDSNAAVGEPTEDSIPFDPAAAE